MGHFLLQRSLPLNGRCSFERIQMTELPFSKTRLTGFIGTDSPAFPPHSLLFSTLFTALSSHRRPVLDALKNQAASEERTTNKSPAGRHKDRRSKGTREEWRGLEKKRTLFIINTDQLDMQFMPQKRQKPWRLSRKPHTGKLFPSYFSAVSTARPG